VASAGAVWCGCAMLSCTFGTGLALLLLLLHCCCCMFRKVVVLHPLICHV
jgi:hypothetical protein